MRLARWSRRTARMLAARIARDTKMRPARRRAQFDTTISPIIDPEPAVKHVYCAILCDPVRICCPQGTPSSVKPVAARSSNKLPTRPNPLFVDYSGRGSDFFASQTSVRLCCHPGSHDLLE